METYWEWDGEKLVEKQRPEEKHCCEQCGKEMGFEFFLGPVCKACCVKNHKKAMRR